MESYQESLLTVKTLGSKDSGVSDKRRDQLVREVIADVRANGNARDALDQAVADRLGINLTDLRCLDVLDQRGRCTAGEIAAALGLSTGAVTTLLDRLGRVGYVERVRDEADRRRVHVELTEAARRNVGQFYKPLAEEAAALMARYDAVELELLRGFLRGDLALQTRHTARIREPAAAEVPAAPPER